MELKLNPGKMVWICAVGMAALLLLHIIACLPMLLMGRSYPWIFLNLGGEQNLPTMFSTVLLLINAFLTGCIAWASKNERRSMAYWVGLAFAFMAMGMDESFMFHERSMHIIREALQVSGWFYFAWVIPYAVLVLCFALVYCRFFFRLPVDTRKHIALAAVLYVGGAIGLEMLGGAWFSAHGKDVVYYLLLVTIEEMLEMAGGIAFIYAFSCYIDRHLPGLSLRITSG